MKEIIYRTRLAIAIVLWLAVAFSRTSKAQDCAAFPSDWVPISKFFYVSDANGDFDRLVVGQWDFLSYRMNPLALPSYPNQKFYGLVEIAPGLSGEAYVPTGAELRGDFSRASFTGLFYDPATARFDPVAGRFIIYPFPGNIIPASRLPSPLP
ncbi:MAG: hypothetical protein EXQ58_05695 [Acidobacteria bacterium]|nr:hypothetical protein [Acidobacteriota bacterium]